MVQWLGLHPFTAEDSSSVPGPGSKIPQAAWHSQKKYIYIYSIILTVRQDQGIYSNSCIKTTQSRYQQKGDTALSQPICFWLVLRPVLVLSQAPDGGREGAAPVMKNMWSKGQNLCEIARQAVSSPFFPPQNWYESNEHVKFLIYSKDFWASKSRCIDGQLKGPPPPRTIFR